MRCVYNFPALTILTLITWSWSQSSIDFSRDSLPDLRSLLTDLDGKFDCDFNHRNFCNFSSNPSDWSFHESMRELADQLKKAAEAAVNALSAVSSDAENQTSDLQLSPRNSVVVPKADYFPCAAVAINASKRFSGVSSFLSRMELLIPWPRLSPLVVPVPIDATDSHSSLLHPRVTRQSGYIQQRDTEPFAHLLMNEPNPDVLACVHLNVRFPEDKASQLNISFLGSTLQTVRTHTDVVQFAAHQTSDVQFNWSLLTHSLNDNRYADEIPRAMWIEVSLPILMDSNMIQDMGGVNSATPPLTVFVKDSVTWLGRLVPTQIQIQATPNVCIDNFRFWSSSQHIRESCSRTHCHRSLCWQNSQTGEKKVIVIDRHGMPARPIVTKALTPAEAPGPLLRLYEKQTVIHGMHWLRFTGSLVLSVSVTILFLLFVCAVGVSILIAHRRRVRHRFETDNPMRKQSRPSMYDRPTDRSAERLFSSTDCTAKFECEFQAVESEANSTQCGESLFLNGTDTFLNSRDNSNLLVDGGLDPSTTSRIQLLRNWRFYRKRADRARQKSEPNQNSCTPKASSPFSLVSPEFSIRDTGRVDAPVRSRRNPSALSNPGRRSLVMCTDANNQLILLPEHHPNSAPSTGLRGPHSAPDRPLEIIPELLSHTQSRLSYAEDHPIDCLHDGSLHSHLANPHLEFNPAGSRTPSTIARSQLYTGTSSADHARSTSSADRDTPDSSSLD